jgi:hypothetical protein
MEHLPQHSGEGRPLADKALIPPEVERTRAERIIEEGIDRAAAPGRLVDDWVARHIALQLRQEDGSQLDILARTGEVAPDFRQALQNAYPQAAEHRRWVDSLGAYAENRESPGPVDGWLERAAVRDRFDAAWRAVGPWTARLHIAGEISQAVEQASDAGQVIDDELAIRIMVDVASSSHSAIARFVAESQVTEELSHELEEKYQLRDQQILPWLDQLGRWIVARTGVSPIPERWPPSEKPGKGALTDDTPAMTANRVARLDRIADLEERLAPLPDLGDIPRPPWGHGFGSGWEWMEALSNGWHPEPGWGSRGWDLGAWPLIVVALFVDDEQQRYAVANYVEGDVEIKRYQSRGALYAAVNGIAEFYWRLGQSRGPKDLPEGTGLRAKHCGPYDPS